MANGVEKGARIAGTLMHPVALLASVVGQTPQAPLQELLDWLWEGNFVYLYASRQQITDNESMLKVLNSVWENIGTPND